MKKIPILIVACFLLVYVLPLGVRTMIMPDETRYAEIPREMIASGDWISPKLAGVRYFEKPVFGYWLTAASMSLFGQNRFASRLPAAAAAGLTAILVFVLARREGTRIGFLSAGIMLSSIMVLAVGVFNVLDGPFTLCLTGMMVFFFLAYSETAVRRKIVLLALCGVFCGLAFLTKGFLALALPVIVAVPFLAWERRWKDCLTLPWIPAITALLIALPWCVLIALREPDFWRYFFWVEHVARFIDPGGPQHPEPFWFFVPVLVGGALPWTTILPAAAAGVRRAGLNDPLIRYCICWLVLPFLFFSAGGGKLGTYILPCFPPLAVLTAIGLESFFAAGGNRLFTIPAALTAAGAAGTLMILIVSQTTGIIGFRLFESYETLMWLPAAAGLLAWSLLAGCSARAVDWRHKVVLFAIAPVVFFTSVPFAALCREVEKEKAPETFLVANADLVSPEAVIVSDDYMGPAVCWFFKRSDVLFLGQGGELQYGLRYADAAGRQLSVKGFNELIAARNAAGADVVLITGVDRLCACRNMLPKPEVSRIDNGFVLLRFRKRT